MSAIGVALATQSGPRLLAGALVFVGGLRFARWAIEFVAERLDSRADRLTEREDAVERRFNLRLKHVEQELDRYREATMLLVNAFAEIEPGNPVLSEVAKILRRSVPVAPPSAELDGLMDRLSAAPGTNKGGSNERFDG